MKAVTVLVSDADYERLQFRLNEAILKESFDILFIGVLAILNSDNGEFVNASFRDHSMSYEVQVVKKHSI